MSVETCPVLYYGWAFDWEDKDEMVKNYYLNTGNYDIEDDFLCVDCYDPESGGWMLGERIEYFPEPGHIKLIDITKNPLEEINENFYEKYVEIFRLCGRSDLIANWHPDLFAVHQVY